MSSNYIKDKLNQAAQKSPSFQNLPLEKQAEIISALEAADDQQVVEAIKAFEADAGNLQKQEQEVKQKEQHLADQAMQLDNEIKATQVEMKQEIKKADSNQEDQSHQEDLNNLEAQLSDLNKPAAPPKRKKFLGIF